jgi:hypothetical protein
MFCQYIVISYIYSAVDKQIRAWYTRVITTYLLFSISDEAAVSSSTKASSWSSRTR